ncbi:hypothetical protein DPMN_088668 [Dreissena polymorpha]|uniref:Uncharacterized protein n=1 Tax=Dreissena polymorpha TaxID=45954 RepID=A0A9D4KUI0_DREPO|nr:hypothetical protein DPMN_088668 [Dreissena polymorpha]
MTRLHPHRPIPGSNTPSTRRQRGLSRTVTTKQWTYTTETRINTDQHGMFTDYPGPARQQHGLTRCTRVPNPICV